MFANSIVEVQEPEDNVISVTKSKVSAKQLKPEDLLQYSNIFASEFNNSSLHDRVLVFQVTPKKVGPVVAVMHLDDQSEGDSSTEEDSSTEIERPRVVIVNTTACTILPDQSSPPDYPTTLFVIETKKSTTWKPEPTLSEGSLNIDGLENNVDVSSSSSNSTDIAGFTEREEKSEDISCQTDIGHGVETERAEGIKSSLRANLACWNMAMTRSRSPFLKNVMILKMLEAPLLRRMKE